LGSSPTLGSLGPSHHERHKSPVSHRGPPCAYGVLNISYRKVRDTSFSQSIVVMNVGTMIQQRILLKPIKVSLGDYVDGIPRCATHFDILKGHHILVMDINVQIFVDLKFLC
jgi:hypothetical protein